MILYQIEIEVNKTNTLNSRDDLHNTVNIKFAQNKDIAKSIPKLDLQFLKIKNTELLHILNMKYPHGVVCVL